jgi:hypothetical protein
MMVMVQLLTQGTAAVSANKTKRQSQASTVTNYANNVQCQYTYMINKTVLYFIIASHALG